MSSITEAHSRRLEAQPRNKLSGSRQIPHKSILNGPDGQCIQVPAIWFLTWFRLGNRLTSDNDENHHSIGLSFLGDSDRR